MLISNLQAIYINSIIKIGVICKKLFFCSKKKIEDILFDPGINFAHKEHVFLFMKAIKNRNISIFITNTLYIYIYIYIVVF